VADADIMKKEEITVVISVTVWMSL